MREEGRGKREERTMDPEHAEILGKVKSLSDVTSRDDEVKRLFEWRIEALNSIIEK